MLAFTDIFIKRPVLATVVSLLILIGFISALRQRLTTAELALPFSLAITVAWPFYPFRFVLPLLPWFIFYLLLGLRAIYLTIQHQREVWPVREPQALLTGMLVALSLICLIGHVPYLITLHGAKESRPAWVRNSAARAT